MHGIHTLSRTPLASIPNLSAIGTIRSGRLKTPLRKQFGKTGRNINMLRISLTNYSCNFEDTMFPQCQCRRPSHSPHACGLEAAFSSIRNKKIILLLLCFLKFQCFYSSMVYVVPTKIWHGDKPEWRHREYEPTESSLTCRTSRWHIFQNEKLELNSQIQRVEKVQQGSTLLWSVSH